MYTMRRNILMRCLEVPCPGRGVHGEKRRAVRRKLGDRRPVEVMAALRAEFGSSRGELSCDMNLAEADSL